MSEQSPPVPLFRVVQQLRRSLGQIQTLGDLVSEKFLIVGGDYIGHQFCFQRGEATWRFADSYVETNIAQQSNRLPISSLVDRGDLNLPGDAVRKAA